MKTLSSYLLVAATALFAPVAVLAAAETPSAQRAPIAPPTAAAVEQVVADFRAVVAAQDRLMRDERWRTLGAAERDRITAAGGELVWALGENLLPSLPADARRWEVIAALSRTRQQFDGVNGAERKAAWEKRRAELNAEVLAANDVPVKLIESVAASEVMASVYRSVAVPDVARARRALDRLAAVSPHAPMREAYEGMFIEALHKTDPSAATERLQQLTRDAEPAVAAMAKNKLTTAALATTPVELKFPDLDGREIDLAQYRGKVVLLDFWATWCVPCMQEMPNLKAAYQKYHAQGLEIIGITDDIPPRDPQNPRGTEKTLAQLKAALAKEAMPWPQLWDTRPKERPGPKALLQQFDIHELPTTMLFDRDGRLYTTDNHGEKLEANIRKLLGLAP
jgi:thiol-disulfide isomerase/thioredoxin